MIEAFSVEIITMHLPKFRVRTLMLLVWLSALVSVAVLDDLHEMRLRNRVVISAQSADADGSRSAVLLYDHRTAYYFGPVPLGPCPTAVFSGLTFVASVAAFVFYRRRTPARESG